MKQLAALSAILLLAPLPSFASHSQPSPSSQLRLKHPHSSAQASSQHNNSSPLRHQDSSALRAPQFTRQPASSRAPGRSAKPRANTSSPAPFAGFVSAVQIYTAGTDDDNTYSVIGDFNGDGKPDAAKVVYTSGEGPAYNISVILSNGDGTFQAAKLTATSNNTDDPIVVGDVNGDGKDDIIMVHPNGGGGCLTITPRQVKPPTGCGVSSFDVYLSNGDGTFTLGNNYLISNFGLNGGLLTDINGDGKLDVLAIDNENPALVVSVLGNGDGSFAAPTTFATLSGPAPYNIFFADFNGDGKLDFAGTTGQVIVYLANSGGFAAPVPLVTSDGTYHSCFNTAGDLTGDGKPEIVSVNCGNVNTVTVYINNGDGSFKPGFYYDNAGDTYMEPNTATIADVNGDGKNDVVVSNGDSGLVSVFLGKGDGSLIIPTLGYDTGGFPWTPALVADFNGDGLADILVPDDYYSFALLPGYGDGTFRAALNYFLPDTFYTGAYSYSVATGDFNGDGFPDVVVGQQNNSATSNPGVAVYLSNPDGSLQPGVYYGASPTLAFVAVGDFNGDGKLDIAATDYNNSVVQIFLGNGDGTFTPGLAYATDTNETPRPGNLITGDFNKDGKLDLAIANSGSGTVGLLFGNGDGTFSGLANYSLSANPYSLAAADLNGDGYLDLAVALETDSANTVAILLNNNEGAGNFHPESDVAMGTGISEYIALGDLNGDGKPDMVFTLNNGGTYPSALVVALGNGDGTFQTATPYSSTAQDGGLGSGWAGNVQMFDFNGDGKLDLVYINDNFGTVGLMLGNGDGTFSTPAEFPTSEYLWGMALADINNDGAMDVVTGNDESGGVSVLLNAGGTATVPNYTLGTQTPTAAVAPGSPATYNLTLVGSNLYNGTVTLACTSGLPSEATCSFTPASVVATGNLPLSSVLTITTTAPATTATVSRPLPPNSSPAAPALLASLSCLGLFGLVLAGGGKKRIRARTCILMGVTLLVMMFALFGCDNDSHRTTTTPPGNPGTPAGSYTVVVTSTGTGTGAPTHTLSLTLVVE